VGVGEGFTALRDRDVKPVNVPEREICGSARWRVHRGSAVDFDRENRAKIASIKPGDETEGLERQRSLRDKSR